jgi:two-component system sensor histidine kinase PilS (NtrC family)
VPAASILDPVPAWRTLRYLAVTRVLVASSVALTLGTLGPRGGLADQAAAPLLLIAVAYLAAAALLAALAMLVPRRFLAQTLAQLALDIGCVSALVVASGGLPGGYAILYLLPLAGASLLLSRVLAYFFCAVAVLVILFDAGLRLLTPPGGESLVFQAGVFGAALFGVTALLQWLSERLAGQERLAAARGRDLQNQLALNRLVIAQMDQGVIVVGRDGRVRANNLAARRMFGLPPEAQVTGRSLDEVKGGAALAEAFRQWLSGAAPGLAPAPWQGTLTQDEAGTPRRLAARFVHPSAADAQEALILMQDLREVESRAQQLKLAAMGRLTASIAHEIRNPLAAISQAGQLLAEDSSDPLQLRLAGIVRDNTRRLNTLVENVLRVARREPSAGDEFLLLDFLREWRAGFEAAQGLDAGRIALDAGPTLGVRFEPSQLRQVVDNLVGNALRYCSDAPGAVILVGRRSVDGGAELWVLDDGPGLSDEARGALFEPFYTSRAQGTGLGLFLAREFCESNGATLEHGEYRAVGQPPREGFVLRFGHGRALEADSMPPV